MMPSFIGASLCGMPPVHYTHDALLEDLSRQMSASVSRRQSRGSNGALPGNHMRVVKPSSASNSPRNNLVQQRRRTMLNDPAYFPRTQQMLEQSYLPTPGPEIYGNSYCEPVKRTTRPVSWHPSTQLPQAYQLSVSTQPSQYPFPSYCDYDFQAPAVQMPPTPAAYSAYSSPVSNLSPLTLPSYTTYDLPQTQAYASPVWNMSAAPVAPSMPSISHVQTPAFVPTEAYTPAPAPSYVEPTYSPASWANVPSTGYSHVTTPPTPEDPPSIQLPEPVVVKQEPVVHSAPELQEEEEEEGDILIGLGLYDPPEKLGLLGASFEPTGKGLKLEDAWEPPAVEEDDEEEEGGEDDDGEGEAESDDE